VAIKKSTISFYLIQLGPTMLHFIPSDDYTKAYMHIMRFDYAASRYKINGVSRTKHFFIHLMYVKSHDIHIIFCV